MEKVHGRTEVVPDTATVPVVIIGAVVLSGRRIPRMTLRRTRGAAPAVPGTPEWLWLARLARMLFWLTLGWLGIEAGVAIAAAVIAGSVARLGARLGSAALRMRQPARRALLLTTGRRDC
jgi:hypothetical protein